MSKEIDLDALMPQAVTIKFNGQNIEVPPPTTAAIFRLASLGQKLASPDKSKDEELEATEAELKALIQKCIPGLDASNLNSAQLLKVVEVLNQMAMPDETKELKERGITSDGPKDQ